MKKLEICVLAENTPKILEILKQNDVNALTVTESLGRGSSERPWMGGPKGHEIEFNVVNTITTIIKDSQVEEIIQFVIDSGSTSSSSGGKIFISSIDDVVDVHTKQRGVKAIFENTHVGKN
jgi:nitrogen regulatory protein P-II 1